MFGGTICHPSALLFISDVCFVDRIRSFASDNRDAFSLVNIRIRFVSQEKGNTPLHVAAKAGQALQVELLVTYGADPAGQDANKQTPEDLARAEGHHELADRLVELQYELSDRLSYFVWKVTPGEPLTKFG